MSSFFFWSVIGGFVLGYVSSYFEGRSDKEGRPLTQSGHVKNGLRVAGVFAVFTIFLAGLKTVGII